MFMFLLLLIIDSYVTFHFLLSTCLSKEFIFKVFITFYLQVSGINLSKKPEFIHHFRFLFSYTNFQLPMFLSRNIRSNRPEGLCKKGVLKNFVKFIGTHLCQSLFFNKVAGPHALDMHNVNDNVLVFLLLTLNIFHTFFLVFLLLTLKK